MIGAQDPSPLLSLPARLDPPIDGRSPKFWGEAICNLAIQRPGAKQARDPGPVFSSFSQHPHIPGICSCRLTILCNSRQPAATTATFFCSCLQVTRWFWSRLLSIGQLFFAPAASPIKPPAQPVAALGLSLLAPTWTPFPKLHRTRPQPPALQTTTRLRHPPSPSRVSIPRLRIALVSSAARVQCILFFVYYILSVFLLSWGFLSPPVAPSHVARPSLTPSLVCPASASRHETCTCCERSRALRDHIAALHLISPAPTNNPGVLPLHPTDLPSPTRARALDADRLFIRRLSHSHWMIATDAKLRMR